MTLALAKRPCGACPYRRDVPSGVWEADEYAKLPPYDRETGDQPTSVFLCHCKDGRLCAGWVAVHDMDHSLGLRLAAALGVVSPQLADEMVDYRTDVPLFDSGTKAAEHGMREVASPSDAAIEAMAKIRRVR